MNTEEMIAYTDSLPLYEALWWYIENCGEGNTGVFFHLRERVRGYKPHVVVTGDPFAGLRLAGPFDGSQQANDFVDDFCESPWWVVEVEPLRG